MVSLARLSLVTAKARWYPGPRFPLPLKSPMPNATALADARGIYIEYYGKKFKTLMKITDFRMI